MRRRAIALAVLLAAGVASEARAQPAPDPPDPPASEADQLFERGTAALLAGRFPEARDLLAESLRLDASPATAFNLVVALLGLEEPLDAARVCEHLLAGRYGEITQQRRGEAETQCARARAETSVLEVVVREPAVAEVRVDGEVVPPAPGPFRALVNPGTHVLTTSADGFETSTRRVRTTRGGRSTVTVTLVEATDSTWWYVGGAAAGVAAIAGAVVAVLLLSRQSDLSAPGFPTEDAGAAP
jgi:hypothetical protein